MTPYRTSTFLILLATFIFSMELLSAVFAYRMVHCLRPTACIINHIGIIRGSIQRVAVHVLAEPLESEQSATEVMDTIDSLIERFLAEQSNYKFKNKQQEGDLVRNMSLIVFDIDHFKSINDKYGHKTGDAVLATAANVAKQHIRQSDALFRIGGDEFAVVVPEANTAQAYEVAEKIRQAIEQHSFAPVERVTISVGASELSDDLTPAALFNQADKALYQAKQNGRNKTRWMQVAPDTCV